MSLTLRAQRESADSDTEERDAEDHGLLRKCIKMTVCL